MCVRRLGRSSLLIFWTWLFVQSATFAAEAEFLQTGLFRFCKTIDQASRKAAKFDRLLLVIDFPDPRPDDPAALAANKSFAIATLRDPEVQQLLDRHFAVCARHYAVPSMILRRPAAASRGGSTDSQTPASQPVSFVCTPDRKVVHFVVGYLTSTSFRDSLHWAVRNYAQATAEAANGSHDNHTWLRIAHSDMVLSADPQNRRFKRNPAEWDSNATGEPTDTEVVTSVFRAREARRDLIRRRYSETFDARTWNRIVSQLVTRPDLGPAVGHYVMADLGLCPLNKLERYVFESWGCQRSVITDLGRVHGLKQRMHLCRVRKRPVVMVIYPDAISRNSSVLLSDTRLQLLGKKNVRRYRELFEVLEVTQAELSWLIADRDEPPITLDRGDDLAFVIYTANGERSSVLVEKNADRELPRALAKVDR